MQCYSGKPDSFIDLQAGTQMFLLKILINFSFYADLIADIVKESFSKKSNCNSRECSGFEKGYASAGI
jgi:hypothetical protein